MRLRTIRFSTAVASILGLAGAASAQWTARVSVDSTGLQSNDASYAGHGFGDDGRSVVFFSDASDLVPGDTNGVTDVFVRNRVTGETSRVSVSSGGDQGHGPSRGGAITSDGRFVVFGSAASNLVPGDTNGQVDCFVHDRHTGRTIRVSVDSRGNEANGENEYHPSISSNGRYVGFGSLASNLVPGDTNGWEDVFVHDLTTGDTQRVSVDSAGGQGNGLSAHSGFSGDGRYFVFHSMASNLVPNDTNGGTDIFLHDRVSGQTTRLSVDSNGNQSDAWPGHDNNWPVISLDGQFVTFMSATTNLVPNDTNDAWDVFVHDRITGSTERVSVDSSGHPSDGDSQWPVISGDGRLVAFPSAAGNLVPGDTNGCADVFLHDRLTGQTSRISVDSNGAQGDGPSGLGLWNGASWPILGVCISPSGDLVGYGSLAANLVDGDTNQVGDVFVYSRTGTPPAPSAIVGWGKMRFDSTSSRSTFVQVDAGYYHTLALRADGTAVAWGANFFGQCDVPALPPGLTYVQIEAGDHFSLAIRSDGSAVGWGLDNAGQSDVPALPPGLSYVHLSAGAGHVVALRSDGSVVAWGDNSYGRCDVPPLPPGLTYVEVDALHGSSLARRSDGSIVVWGYNADGQCNVPPLPAGLTYLDAGVGYFHILARRSDGAVVTWGYNVMGQCNVPPLPPGLTWVKLIGGAEHSLGLRSDGSLIAWGSNTTGQCNVPPLPPGLTYTQMAGGGDDAIWGQFRGHSVALRSDGSVVSWGLNDYFQCNLPPVPAGVDYTEVSAGGTRVNLPYSWGEGHVLARLSDGTVQAFGRNDEGQCNVPAPPPGTFYVEVDAGSQFYSLGRRSDGTVVGWGDNAYGQRNVPLLPPGLSYVEVAAGARHALGRRSDGAVVAWGDNAYGQCNVPALPPALTYVELAASWRHSVARRNDGSVVAWGSNASGQCEVPALPPGLAYVEVAAGYENTIARRSDGTVVAWGDNSLGQCNVPALPPGTTYVEIAAGAEYTGNPVRSNTLARRSDGAIVVWGDTGSGQADLPPLPAGISLSELAAGGLFTVARLGSGSTCISPSTYCVAKTNSLGCTPSMGWQGQATQSGADDFWITASQVRNRKLGMLLWSLGSANTPFFGGTLCVAQPIHRTPGQSSGGSASGDDCTGTYSFHFSQAYMLQHLLGANQTVFAQYWSRDPGYAPPANIGLTDGLRFVICP